MKNNRVIPLFLILNKTFYFFLFRNGRKNRTKKEKKEKKGRRNESYKLQAGKSRRKMNNHLNQKNHSSDFFDCAPIGA
ncbi:MAG: hypothetical protein LBL13_07105 [Bacteroidales bacterium]|nr:hypothetical protein [Bacteroidales bacterium]